MANNANQTAEEAERSALQATPTISVFALDHQPSCPTAGSALVGIRPAVKGGGYRAMHPDERKAIFLMALSLTGLFHEACRSAGASISAMRDMVSRDRVFAAQVDAAKEVCDRLQTEAMFGKQLSDSEWEERQEKEREREVRLRNDRPSRSSISKTIKDRSAELLGSLTKRIVESLEVEIVLDGGSESGRLARMDDPLLHPVGLPRVEGLGRSLREVIEDNPYRNSVREEARSEDGNVHPKKLDVASEPGQFVGLSGVESIAHSAGVPADVAPSSESGS